MADRFVKNYQIEVSQSQKKKQIELYFFILNCSDINSIKADLLPYVINLQKLKASSIKPGKFTEAP